MVVGQSGDGSGVAQVAVLSAGAGIIALSPGEDREGSSPVCLSCVVLTFHDNSEHKIGKDYFMNADMFV